MERNNSYTVIPNSFAESSGWCVCASNESILPVSGGVGLPLFVCRTVLTVVIFTESLVRHPNTCLGDTYLLSRALHKGSSKHGGHPIAARDEQRFMGHYRTIIQLEHHICRAHTCIRCESFLLSLQGIVKGCSPDATILLNRTWERCKRRFVYRCC